MMGGLAYSTAWRNPSFTLIFLFAWWPSFPLTRSFMASFRCTWWGNYLILLWVQTLIHYELWPLWFRTFISAIVLCFVQVSILTKSPCNKCIVSCIAIPWNSLRDLNYQFLQFLLSIQYLQSVSPVIKFFIFFNGMPIKIIKVTTMRHFMQGMRSQMKCFRVFKFPPLYSVQKLILPSLFVIILFIRYSIVMSIQSVFSISQSTNIKFKSNYHYHYHYQCVPRGSQGSSQFPDRRFVPIVSLPPFCFCYSCLSSCCCYICLS